MPKSTDPEVQKFFEIADFVTLPSIDRSLMAAAVWEGNINAQQCIEVGAMVLMDKPFILVVPEDMLSTIPTNLKRVATAVIPVDPSDHATTKAKVESTIKGLLENDARVREQMSAAAQASNSRTQ